MLRRMILGGVAAVLAAGLAAPLHAQVDPELLAGMRARSIGPAGMSGRIADIKAVESDPNIIYVGGATGGVWKSVNGGLNFDPIFDDQPVHAIGSLAIFQASPDIVWVGTGEGNPRNSVSGTGYGVFKSMDGGRTWTHLGLENTERIHRIALHPGNPDVAYVGAMGSMWKPNPERGVFKTEDGGASWQKILYVNENTGVGDMEMDPTNPNKLIVAMWDYQRWPWFFRSGGPGSGLYLTVDGGRNWQRLTSDDGLPEGDLGRIGLAIAPSSPNIVYALVEANENALYKSEDGGFSWARMETEGNIGNRPFYYFDLRVDPQDANRVYSLFSQVTVSTDGGRSFQGLVRGGVHSDHHAMWIDPNDPRHIIEGNDGGVYISHDHGQTWRFVGNLPLAEFYHINVDVETPYHVMGGLQDNGSWRGPAYVWERGAILSHHWISVGGGDGFGTLAVPSDPNVGYSMSQGGNLRRWNVYNGGSKDIRPAHPEGVELRFNWNAAIAIDPFDPNTVYYGSQFLHKSTDRGDSWEIISPDLTTNNPEWQKQEESGGLTYDVTGAENFTTIMTIAPSPVQQGVIWVGTDDGRVHVTQDGGASWTSLEDRARGVPANTWVPHIEPSKYDAGTAYVVFDNHRRGDFTPYAFAVTEYGRRWRSIVNDDIWGYALVVEQDPVKEDLLFLGTEFGLYVSLDGGQGWMKWEHGLPTASVMALMVHPREHDLVIGTHGRAVYIIDDIRPLRELSTATLAEPIHLFEIPDAIQYSSNQSAGEGSPGSGEFRGENRQYGARLTFSLNAEDLPRPGEAQAQPAGFGRFGGFARMRGGGAGQGERRPQVTVEISDASGAVIRTFQAPVTLGVNRITWNLRQDGFRRPSAGGQQQQRFFGFGFGGGGPDVLPGTYGVKVKYGDQEATGSVNVLGDPRYDIPTAEREAKIAAIRYAGSLQEVVADAVERIRGTRTEVEAVLAKVREQRQRGGPGEVAQAGRRLVAALTELENKFWSPPGSGGQRVVRPENVLGNISGASRSMGSSWDAPTQAQEYRLQQAEAMLNEAVEEYNRLFAEDVAQFIEQVDAAGLTFVHMREPLAMPQR